VNPPPESATTDLTEPTATEPTANEAVTGENVTGENVTGENVTPEATGDAPVGYFEMASQWGNDTPEGSAQSWLGLAGLIAAMVGIGVIFSWYVVAGIMAIVLSVVLHEAGHFIAAKKSGMKVTEAFIGFGPRIWSFRRGESEYGIKAVWAGAYVKIIGMHSLEEVDARDEELTYRSKNYPRRLITILAGPMANIFLCWIMFTAFLFFGRMGSPFEQAAPTDWPIRILVEGGAAEASGLRVGDQITGVNGRPTRTNPEFISVLRSAGSGDVSIQFQRDGAAMEVKPNLQWRIGAGSAAKESLFLEADIVESVKGNPAGSWDDFRTTLRETTGEIPVVVNRKEYRYELPLVGPIDLPADGDAGFLGVKTGPADLPSEVTYSLPGAAVASAQMMGTVVKLTGQSFGKFFTPEGFSRYGRDLQAASNTSGREAKPLGPIEGASPYAKPNTSTVSEERPNSIVGGVQALGSGLELGGLLGFLLILGAINMSLGVLNLLPLLPFDGGHAVVATYERLRSRKGRQYRVDMMKLMPLTYAVVLLLVVFGLTSMFLDIRSPVSP